MLLLSLTFCTTGLGSSKKVAQMYEEPEMVLEHLTPVTFTID